MEPFNWRTTQIESVPTLIEASAGTGKTYAITGLVLRLLLERHVSQVRHILVVTFTRAATRELTGRIRTRLTQALAVFRGELEDRELEPLAQEYGEEGQVILTRACLELEELSIFTIHGFCRRMLEQNAFESGLTFSPTFIEDHQSILAEAARDFWRRTFLHGNPLLAEIAIVKKWSPTSLLETTSDCRKQSGASYEPLPLTLGQAVANLTQAIAKLKQAWDSDHIRRFFVKLNFLAKDRPYQENNCEAFLDKLAEATAENPPANSLEAILKMNRSAQPDKLKLAQRSNEEIIAFLAHPFFEACRQVAIQVDQLESSLRVAFLEEVEQRFRLLKNRAQQLDFDDLLQQLHEILSHPRHGNTIRRAISNQYQAGLIDEFQDTDKIQFEIFHSLFPHAPLFFIGDPKQAIYSFRGADLHAYLTARNATSRQYTLGTNWRSHQNLVDAVNRLFQVGANPFLVPEITYRPVEASGHADKEVIDDDGRAMHWWLIPASVKTGGKATELVLARMIEEISRLLTDEVHLGQRRLRPFDLAVLVRTNPQAEAVLQALRSAGIAGVVSGSGDIFQTAEMNDLLLFIQAVIHPQQPHALQTAMATGIWGADGNTIYSLTKDESLLQAALTNMDSFRSVWRRRGFLTMVHTAFSRLGTYQRLLAQPQGNQRLTHLRHAAEILQQYSNSTAVSPQGLLRWLQREKTQSSHEGLDTELRLAANEMGVQILTIHKSKGLEYQIVFCPFLWKGQSNRTKKIPKFHNEAGEIKFDLQPIPNPEHLQSAIHERTAEDLRLLYVALTRARQRCYLAWGLVKGESRPALSTFFYGDPDPLPNWIQKWPHLMLGEQLAPMEVSHRLLADEISPPTPARLQPARTFHKQNAQLDPWRITSFSSLTSNSKSSKAHRYDPQGTNQEPAGTGFFGFARGARAGHCLHEVFEYLDFSDTQSPAAREQIETSLARFDLIDPKRHRSVIQPADEVAAMLMRVCNGPLPGESFALAHIPPDAQLKEWPFHLPLDQFQVGDFYQCFANFANDKTQKDYAPKLQSWDRNKRLNGFLTGIVDLCFVYAGRWFLVDWKSNDLGPNTHYYQQPHLWQAMCDHHYVLQYHLYTLALHRFLRSRIPDYQYERHIGGVYYAFLRGIDGESRRGWYLDKPAYRLIQAFDQRCEGQVNP